MRLFYITFLALVFLPRLSVAQSGNVGVGTATPAARLEVVAADNGLSNIFTVRSANLSRGIGLNKNTVAAIGTDANIDLTLVSKGSNSSILLNPSGNASVGSSFTVDAAGLNAGTLASGGLRFGPGGNAGIASKQTSGGTQYGLDFYVNSGLQMSLTSGGRLLLGTAFSSGIVSISNPDPNNTASVSTNGFYYSDKGLSTPGLIYTKDVHASGNVYPSVGAFTTGNIPPSGSAAYTIHHAASSNYTLLLSPQLLSTFSSNTPHDFVVWYRNTNSTTTVVAVYNNGLQTVNLKVSWIVIAQ